MLVQQAPIFWCMNETFCAHMLPVKRCPLFGWKWSFSRHCNALGHIKERGWGDHPLSRLVTFGQRLFIFLRHLRLAGVWLDAAWCQQKVYKQFPKFYYSESIWTPEMQGSYIGPPCFKRFGLVLLSDIVTHGVATDRWADGSLSAPYSD